MSLQERLEMIRSSPVPRNEESAKVQFLVPILQSLRWDPSEILPEHHVGEMRRRGRTGLERAHRSPRDNVPGRDD